MSAQNIKLNKLEKGFTLIELLVVIGILAVLLAITLIAINPARQFAQANDTKRRSDVTQILNSVGQYFAEHHGVLPPNLAALANDTPEVIGGNTGEVDLCADLVPTYMPALPRDPRNSVGEYSGSCPALYTTGTAATVQGYQIAHDANNRVTVSADSEIDNATSYDITVTR